MSTKTPACRLALVLYPRPGAAECAAAVMAAADVASLIIGPAAGTPLTAANVKPLVALAQARGVAALVADNAHLARTLAADGVHLTWSDDIVARHAHAREILGGDFIAGADAGRSRHDAMQLGEAGADYIAFGLQPSVEDRDDARALRFEFVSWWADIFAPPVVAFDVDDMEDAIALVHAGADFVALSLPRDLPASRVADWLRPVLSALRNPVTAG